MAIAFGTLLVLFSIAVIAYPFIRPAHYRSLSNRFVHRETLRTKRWRVYRKIIDLQADFASGDLTEPDYVDQRNQLRIVAAELLRYESDRTPIAQEEQLEKEIAILRNQSTLPPES
jgi:hypothetical protein